jgi:membrane-bound lytic murein transglycosylase D
MNHLPSARSLRLGTDLVVPVPSASALKAGKFDVAIERQVARARRSGLAAPRPEEEIPAGSQPAPTAAGGKVAVAGSIAVETVGGKKRVTYGVGRGDSLWAIARRFDVHVADLKEWNESLTSGRGLKVGQPITIWPGAAADLSVGGAAPSSSPAVAPRAATAAASPKAGTKHTVGNGESMWSIAKKYGCSIDELKRWNNLGAGALKKGQTLIVAQ